MIKVKNIIVLFQVLSGIYPIAQVREPYTCIGYLAERVPIVELLQLSHPEEEKESDEMHISSGAVAVKAHNWTAWNVCDG